MFEDGGEVSNDDFIRQMTVGTLPADAQEGKAEGAFRALVEGTQGFLGLEPGQRGTEAYRTGQALSNIPPVAIPLMAVKAVPMVAGAVEDVATRAVQRITENPNLSAVDVYNAMFGKQAPGVPITTYHGSGNLFQQLDAGKAKSGVGEQRYGAGAGYTAQSRPVAESFIGAEAQALRASGGMDPKLEFVYDLVSQKRSDKDVLDMVAARYGDSISFDEAADILQKAKAMTKGYLYKGDIPDEILPSFLDWNKSLKQQTPEIKKLLGKDPLVKESANPKRWDEVSGGIIQKGEGGLDDLTGDSIYKYISLKLGSDSAATEYLDKLGVRGIRYADPGSKGLGRAPSGTSNFVVFRPEDYRIESVNDMPIGKTVLPRSKGTGKASQMLEEIAKKAGIDNLITAEKSLLNLDDTNVSLQDAVRMRVAEQQRLINSMPFKYEPGQMVYTSDTVKRNMPPLEIVGKRIETRLVKDPNDFMKTIKDPATGRALRHPPEQSYFVTQRFPNGDVSSFTIPESAILGPLDGMAEGGEVTNDEFIEQMTVGTRPTDQGPVPYDQTAAAQFADYLRAPVDLAQTAVRGTIGSVVGPAYGLYKGVTDGKYGTPEGVREASAAGGELMQKITGEPKSQAAKDLLQFLGEKAEALKLAPMPQLMTAPIPGRGAVRFQGEAAKGAVEDIALRAVRAQTQNPDITAAQLYNAMLGKQAPGAAVVKPTGSGSSVPKATSIFEEIPTTRTTATQYGVEFVQSPFVGRLDKMIAELPGPVQKEQFLNQLKGKFRDYDIGRAKEALRDLPDNAKITPFDLLNKIKEDFDPSRYGTSIIKPDPNNPDRFYAGTDDIYKAPLGIIHLRQLPNPLVNADLDQTKKMYDALRSKTYGGIVSDLREPDVFNNYKNNVNELLRSINQPEKSEGANKLLNQAQYSLKLYDEISDAYDTIVYPILSPFYKALQNQQKATTGNVDSAASLRMTIQAGADKLENLFPGTKVESYLDVQTLLSLDPVTRTKAASNIASIVNPLSSAVNEVFRQNMTDLRNLLEKSYTDPKSPLTQFEYKGQHANMVRTPTQSGIPNEIAFSRYSEHTTDVPGLGKVDGIYVNELQSDRLDDIRGKGPLGGSPAKDLPKATELRNKLQDLTEQAAVENQRYLDNPVAEQREKLREIMKQQEKTQQQLAKWTKRITQGDYKIKESFFGMEESPQVIQQLMAKNVVAAAIQMGKNFVAFPGAESAQPQLYEKLPNNLKQVVKDLGPGFEYRPITLRTPDGQEMMHPAIVWDKYGAGKIGAEGVPFKKGGEVRTQDFIKKVLK